MHHTIEDHALKEDVMKHSCRSLIGALTAMTLMGLASPAAMADNPAPAPTSGGVCGFPTQPTLLSSLCTTPNPAHPRFAP